MLKQVAVMVSNALEGATYGVNAMLDRMQTLGYFGAGPDYPERPSSFTAALNAYQDRIVADQGDALVDTPLAIVTIDVPFQGKARHPDEDSIWRFTDTLAVAIRLVSGDGDGELANRHADHLTRAIVWSLRELFSEEHEADRRLEGIMLFDCQEVLYGPVEEKYGPATVTAAVVLTVRARDFAD